MALPNVPTRVSSLFTSKRQALLEAHKQRSVSLSSFSVASNASDFLAEKIKACQSTVDYWEDYGAGLREAKDDQSISTDVYKTEINRMLDSYKPAVEELDMLRKQHKILLEDIEDESDAVKRQNAQEEPSVDFYQRAYTSIMIPRIMGATAKQRKGKFNQGDFKKAIVDYYSAVDKPKERSYCHLMGWLDMSAVKCAHLVPKLLSGPELAFIFGVEQDDVLYNPRNGITLHKNIERALDEGRIVIIPVPSAEDESTRWKCVLVDESMSNRTFCWVSREYKWQDLDGKELTFLSENRPARRYLYFRFIISYIHAARNGNTNFIEKVDNKAKFWESPGPYLQRSTLVSLARNISGMELPPSIYQDNTFDDLSEESNKQVNRAANLLASDLREAEIASLTIETSESDDDDDDDDED